MIKVCVVGYGNIGRSVIEALNASADMELVGVVRRSVDSDCPKELCDVQVVDNVNNLSQKPDVAILCTPSRSIPTVAAQYLALGINTVDSYDIHYTIYDLKLQLEAEAKKTNSVAVIAAGWDPGSDSVVRALMESCAPKGITYTNFGPGMSMGHTVAVKAIKGVKAALSMTIPLGTGIHRRMVYIEIEDGYALEDVRERIKSDAYFENDETHVIVVDDVNKLIDMGHAVSMIRKGVSGATQNQIFEFDMHINNPALTAQNLVNCARASMRQASGAYTMVEIPVIDLLAGDKEALIRHLV